MTVAQIKISLGSLARNTDITSRRTATALKKLCAEVNFLKNYVTEEDRLNQAIDRLIKVWAKLGGEYSIYSVIISKLKNEMYSFSQIEQLTEGFESPTFEVLLGRVRREPWAKYVSYADLKNVYNLRCLNEY